MPAITISRTKVILPPRRPELLSRPRLLENLSASLDRKLILLTAPAGYGKTSLLIDLAYSTHLPVCWLALDEHDRDPQRFMAYLVAALAERFPGLEAPLVAQLDQLKSINTDAEPLLVNLTNELYDQVDRDFLLILDDYHALEGVPIIATLMTRFLQLVDDNCHVIISSRTLAPLPDLMLMVGRDQVEGLDQAQLAFLPGEVQALFAQNQHRQLSEATAEHLIAETGGWITGVLLSDLTGGAPVSGLNAYTYLGQQVLDRQPAALRTFLLRTSVPEEYDAELCTAVLDQFEQGADGWPALMQQVIEKNLFVQLVGEGGRWLRYHPLFRDLLRTRFESERPQEVRPLLESLVAIFEHKQEWDKAYYTCQQMDDPEALADVVEHAGPAMVWHALVSLESWIHNLPPSIVKSRPGLVTLRGVLATEKGFVQEGLAYYNEAEAFFRRRQDHAGLARTLLYRATNQRYLGNYTAALEDIEESLGLTEPRPELQNLYAEALRVQGVIQHRIGKSKAAIESFERSLALFTAIKRTDTIPILLMETAMSHQESGDLQSALDSYLQALEIWRAEDNLQWQASLLNNLAVLYHQLGDYEQASSAFENGLKCATRSRSRRTEALILAGLGDLYTEVEEFETAALAYRRAEIIAVEINDAFIQNYVFLAQALLAVRQGDAARARQNLEEHAGHLQVSPSTYERGLQSLIEGRIFLLKGLASEAIQILRECKRSFIEDGRAQESMWSRIWLAAAFQQAGQVENARAEIREQLALQGQNEHPLWICLAQAAAWLDPMRSDPEIGRSLATLLERASKAAARLPAARRSLRHLTETIQIPSARLRLNAFGRAEVQVNGRSLSMADWHTQSVRNLLFYFLYEYRHMTKEQIGSAMWPEIEDARTLQSRFRNDMHRLRRAVGRDVIVYYEEYYRFNRALDYEYDVETFESLLASARSRRGEPDCIEVFKKAVDLVSGPYLPGLDYKWADEERERLRHTFLSALEELAGLYLNANQLDEAAQICRRALLEDIHQESLYRLLMRTHAAHGDKFGVVQSYQECHQALAQIEFAPSEETRLLYRQLIGSEPPPLEDPKVKSRRGASRGSEKSIKSAHSSRHNR